MIDFDSHIAKPVTEQSTVPIHSIIPAPREGSASAGGTMTESGSPTKRRRLQSPPSTPILSGERLKSVLFSKATSARTSFSNTPPSLNLSVSSLFPQSRRMESETFEPKKIVLNRLVAKLLSRNYLLGLPRSCTDSNTDDPGQEACQFLENTSALPMERLIDGKLDP